MKILITIISTIFWVSCNAQATTYKSLIVAEYQQDDSGVGNYTHLAAYNFAKGQLISKNIIFGAPVSKKGIPGSYVRFDLRKNFIYKNRYVVSGIGNVIDVQTKSLVIEDSDTFIEAKEDTMLFHRDNVYTGTGYLILDLKTKKYEFVKDKNFRAIQGLQSPHRTYGVKVDMSRLPWSIHLCNVEQKCKKIVNDCGYGTFMSSESSSLPTVPILWIDNDNFIFAHYSSNVEIRTVHIHNKLNELVGIIDSVPPAVVNASFARDVNGNVVFRCAKGHFQIDVVNNTIIPYRYRHIGHEFQVEIQSDNVGK
ncbi:MAG: hypothetical protein D3910_07260, partial [Candidatus Electrothrix sp. ATG2]|nr:hypothetical protein [Candidatus Electrothrix sp. ATG2]